MGLSMSKWKRKTKGQNLRSSQAGSGESERELIHGHPNGDEDKNEEFLTQKIEMDRCNSVDELRIFVGTWNVAGRPPIGSLAVDLDEWLNLKDAADIYVLGFQEIVPLRTRAVIGAEDPSKATNWNLLIERILNDKYGCPWLTPIFNQISVENPAKERETDRRMSFHTQNDIQNRGLSRTHQSKLKGGSRYMLLASKKMVGVFISVWIKKELLRKYSVSNVKVCSVACGIMGCLGNKGSVSVSMALEGTSFCFVVAHLASGENKGDERRRNHQVMKIFKRTVFPPSPKDDNLDHPRTILGHDEIFWFGDLNYRLYLEDNFARQLIEKQDWKALQVFDELRREKEDGVFQGWKEGNIKFAPTYKYSSSNCNRYSGGPLRRSGEKQRTPAWCDRILWFGKGVKQISYFRSEIKFSDHRPVSAIFSTKIEVLKPTNPRVASLKQSEEMPREEDTTSESLVLKDTEESPSHAQNSKTNC